MDVMPKFPIYIVSKGRFKNALTMRALDIMGLDYRVIVEKDEFINYADVYGCERVIALPNSFKDEYDTFWDRGKVGGRTGPGAARNFAWDHSVKGGYSHHWVMDDNLDAFHRMHNNEKWECESPAIFRAMEDFTLRFKNVGISGPNYYSFAKATDALPPFITNTRIYSCLFIKNDLPFRWRGTYNEDTDLSLRVLKSGLCTIQFNAFLQGKVTTQRMKGGNTDEFYSKDGTYDKSKMLEDMHPDVAKVKWKFNRWHHEVNYKIYKTPLTYNDEYVNNTGINNYGMKLVEI